MIEVDSDDPILADLLTTTLELIVDAGGWVHPQTRILARDGQFSVECGGEVDVPLLVIPRAAFLRVDAVTWDEDPSLLRVVDVPHDTGDTEISLLHVQSALHNQARRLEWIARTHPAVADLRPDVESALRDLVPGFRLVPTTPRDVLFANRCLRVDLGDGRGAQRVLVPLLDLLNHHAAGAAASWDGESFAISVRRPFGTAECALDYGLDRDAMELAAVYGFADTGAGIAHLPHVTVDVPGVGVVSVRGEGRQPSGGFASLTVRHDDAGAEDDARVEISHLTFARDAMTMQSLVDELTQAAGWDAAASRAALQALGDRAHVQTLQLRDLCVGDDDVMAVVRGAAALQGAVLSAALEVLESD